LFRGAIAESGSSAGSGPMSSRTLAEQEQLGLKFAEAKSAKSLADLRAMSWQDLTAPVPGAAGPGSSYRFGAVVDGYFLKASVVETFARGEQNDVTTITGCNKGEGGAVPSPDITAEAYQKQARERYKDLADEFLKLYPGATDEAARVAQNESSWDQARVSMYLWAARRAKTAKTKAYTYFWDHTLPGPDAAKYGAFHTSEVPYFMNALAMSDRPFTPADHKIAGMMSSYLVNFVTTSDPNGKDLPRWPSVSDQTATTMEVGDQTAPIPVAGDKAKLAFFEKHFSRP
jgi:carboxylesterase type B